MQYRQGVMWQMCGYNQPPHTSYFLGQLEGITIAPPPIMTNGRTLVGNGGTVDASSNDKHILIYETSDISVNIADGASPYITTINAPSWVQGHDDNDNIKFVSARPKMLQGERERAYKYPKSRIYGTTTTEVFLKNKVRSHIFRKVTGSRDLICS